MAHFDTDPNGADVYSRPLAPWEDQQPVSPTASWSDLKDPTIQMKPGGVGLGNLHRAGSNYKPVPETSTSTEHTGKVKRNVLQTPAFKTAIAALDKKQPRVPSRDRTREEIAKGTSWGTNSLTKTPFWAINDGSNSPSAPQRQQVDYHQQPIEYQQKPVEENVLATFDISFVSDTEMKISIAPSKTDVPQQNGTAFQPADMTLEKSTDSSTVSTQPQPTATTSRSSFGSVGYGGTEMSIWENVREEERLKAEKEAAEKATKWNPKAQSFQFTPNQADKPVTPIFEFANPNDELEKPFFTFTGKDTKDPPLFDFSTALNATKISYSDKMQQTEEEQDPNLFAQESQEFTFSFPVSKKVVISSPRSDTNKNSKKPNPEAPAFTPTLSNASVASSSSSSKPAWNPKVTEFVPTVTKEEPIPDLNIPSFVTRPKSTKVIIKPPQEEEIAEDLQSQTQPETTRGLQEPIPLLQINISFAPGVTGTLRVFKEDIPKHVVAEFCRKHDLTMTQRAQNSFIDTLTKLKQAKLDSLSKNK